jgi:hypothetical protein
LCFRENPSQINLLIYYPWDTNLYVTSCKPNIVEHSRRKICQIINLHNDVVDGNVDELNKEANEAHQAEANSCGHGNLLEFCKSLKLIIKYTQQALWKVVNLSKSILYCVA